MTVVITREQGGKTIKELLLRDMGFSTGLLKKLKFRENGITVNGSFATVRYVLKEGDVLTLSDEDRAEDTSPYITPVDLPLKIPFEDAHLTVCDKGAAMPAHPSFSHRDDTVANALAYRYKDSNYVFRPVNRLDCDTSGLMLTANDHLSAVRLYRSMLDGKIGKMYIALLNRAPENEYGVIDLHMKRCDASVITRRVASQEEEGARRAVTVYKKIYTDEKSGECAVIASPVTGRTHQLRVHFSAIGCPIIGDYLYGTPDGRIRRHALHAAYLSFPHPASGEIMHIYSPLADDMKVLFNESAEALLARELEKEAFGTLRDMYNEMKKDIPYNGDRKRRKAKE